VRGPPLRTEPALNDALILRPAQSAHRAINEMPMTRWRALP
jgi:hypothetical protein